MLLGCLTATAALACGEAIAVPELAGLLRPQRVPAAYEVTFDGGARKGRREGEADAGGAGAPPARRFDFFGQSKVLIIKQSMFLKNQIIKKTFSIYNKQHREEVKRPH